MQPFHVSIVIPVQFSVIKTFNGFHLRLISRFIEVIITLARLLSLSRISFFTLTFQFLLILFFHFCILGVQKFALMIVETYEIEMKIFDAIVLKNTLRAYQLT